MYAKLTPDGNILNGAVLGSGHRIERSDFGQMPAGWSIGLLNSVEQMTAIADDWRDVEAQCVDTQAVFQSYAWCMGWAQCYCGDGPGEPKPQIYLLKHHGALKAVLPMMLEQNGFVSILTILGEPHTQLANILLSADDCPQDILSAFVTVMSENSSADVIALGPIPDGCSLIDALTDQNLRPDPATHISAVVWEHGQASSDYLNAISKNRRKDLLKKQRRLEEIGDFSFDVIDPHSTRFRSTVDTAIEWKREWLLKKSMVSVGLSSDKLTRFLSSLGQNENPAEASFQPEVEVLSVGGKPIAISISMVGKGFRHCYLSAYDPDFADVSPGTLVHQFAIQHSIDEHLSGYSFLGYPTHFKSLWCNQQIGLVRYIKGTSVKGVIWVQVWALWLRPLAKSVLELVKITKLTSWINRLLSKT